MRCFSSPRSPPSPYEFRRGYPGFAWVGFPIRKSPGQRPFAPHRSLSQLVASFIAGRCQGIPRVPLFTSNITFGLRRSPSGSNTSSRKTSALSVLICKLTVHPLQGFRRLGLRCLYLTRNMVRLVKNAPRAWRAAPEPGKNPGGSSEEQEEGRWEILFGSRLRPRNIRHAPGKAAGKGDVWVSTPKEKTS
jgi:hypothetical protein